MKKLSIGWVGALLLLAIPSSVSFAGHMEWNGGVGTWVEDDGDISPAVSPRDTAVRRSRQGPHDQDSRTNYDRRDSYRSTSEDDEESPRSRNSGSNYSRRSNESSSAAAYALPPSFAYRQQSETWQRSSNSQTRRLGAFAQNNSEFKRSRYYQSTVDLDDVSRQEHWDTSSSRVRDASLANVREYDAARSRNSRLEPSIHAFAAQATRILRDEDKGVPPTRESILNSFHLANDVRRQARNQFPEYEYLFREQSVPGFDEVPQSRARSLSPRSTSLGSSPRSYAPSAAADHSDLEDEIRRLTEQLRIAKEENSRPASPRVDPTLRRSVSTSTTGSGTNDGPSSSTSARSSRTSSTFNFEPHPYTPPNGGRTHSRTYSDSDKDRSSGHDSGNDSGYDSDDPESKYSIHGSDHSSLSPASSRTPPSRSKKKRTSLSDSDADRLDDMDPLPSPNNKKKSGAFLDLDPSADDGVRAAKRKLDQAHRGIDDLLSEISRGSAKGDVTAAAQARSNVEQGNPAILELKDEFHASHNALLQCEDADGSGEVKDKNSCNRVKESLQKIEALGRKDKGTPDWLVQEAHQLLLLHDILGTTYNKLYELMDKAATAPLKIDENRIKQLTGAYEEAANSFKDRLLKLQSKFVDPLIGIYGHLDLANPNSTHGDKPSGQILKTHFGAKQLDCNIVNLQEEPKVEELASHLNRIVVALGGAEDSEPAESGAVSSSLFTRDSLREINTGLLSSFDKYVDEQGFDPDVANALKEDFKNDKEMQKVPRYLRAGKEKGKNYSTYHKFLTNLDASFKHHRDLVQQKNAAILHGSLGRFSTEGALSKEGQRLLDSADFGIKQEKNSCKAKIEQGLAKILASLGDPGKSKKMNLEKNRFCMDRSKQKDSLVKLDDETSIYCPPDCKKEAYLVLNQPVQGCDPRVGVPGTFSDVYVALNFNGKANNSPFELLKATRDNGTMEGVDFSKPTPEMAGNEVRLEGVVQNVKDSGGRPVFHSIVSSCKGQGNVQFGVHKGAPVKYKIVNNAGRPIDQPGVLRDGELDKCYDSLDSKIAKLHSVGVIHRDVKAANSLSDKGDCSFIDLGAGANVRGGFFTAGFNLTKDISPIDPDSDGYNFFTVWEALPDLKGNSDKMKCIQLGTHSNDKSELVKSGATARETLADPSVADFESRNWNFVLNDACAEVINKNLQAQINTLKLEKDLIPASEFDQLNNIGSRISKLQNGKEKIANLIAKVSSDKQSGADKMSRDLKRKSEELDGGLEPFRKAVDEKVAALRVLQNNNGQPKEFVAKSTNSMMRYDKLKEELAAAEQAYNNEKAHIARVKERNAKSVDRKVQRMDDRKYGFSLNHYMGGWIDQFQLRLMYLKMKYVDKAAPQDKGRIEAALNKLKEGTPVFDPLFAKDQKFLEAVQIRSQRPAFGAGPEFFKVSPPADSTIVLTIEPQGDATSRRNRSNDASKRSKAPSRRKADRQTDPDQDEQ